MKTKKRKVGALMIILLLLPIQALAEPQARFEKANSAYTKGNVKVAIHDYEQLLHEQGASAALLFNLAHAYNKAGEPGKAILHYKRAENLSPGDADISESLKQVRKTNGLFSEPAKGSAAYFGLLHPNHWALILLFSLSTVTILQLVSCRWQTGRIFYATTQTLCFLGILFSGIGLIHAWPNLNPSIVISPKISLYLSPIEGAEQVREIRQGREVYPLKTHGDFVYVRDYRNIKGWIPASSLEAVHK